MIKVNIDSDILVFPNYRNAYNYCIEKLASYSMVESDTNTYKDKYNRLLKAAIKFFIASESKDVKHYVKSDYEMLIQNDNGNLLNQITDYLDVEDDPRFNHIEQLSIAKTLIRNCKEYAMRKIKVDIAHTVWGMDNGANHG